MALLINDDCVNCGNCEPGCPNEAISAGDDIYMIDPAKCTQCVGFFDKPQCIEACPAICIVPDPQHPLAATSSCASGSN